MLTSKEVNNLIKKGNSHEFLRRNPSEVVKNVREIVAKVMPIAIMEVSAIAPFLKGKSQIETAQNIHQFVRKYIKYVLDSAGEEYIRYPFQTWKDKKGDCEDFAIMVAALLCANGIDCALRVVKIDAYSSHIYCVMKKGMVVDGTLEEFGSEVVYHTKTDYPISFVGLGKLPKNIWSPRENFITDFWKMLTKEFDLTVYKERAVVGQIVLEHFPDGKPKKTKDIYGVEYIIGEFPLYHNAKYDKFPIEKMNELFYDKTKKILNVESVKLEIDKNKNLIFAVTLHSGQNFKIGLDKLPNLINQIEGTANLNIVATPITDDELPKTALSPFNKTLMKELLPFASQDDLRPAQQGIYFNQKENRVEVTNGHLLVNIYVSKENEVLEDGIYSKLGDLIDARFPDTHNAIRKESTKVFELMDLKSFMIGLKHCIKYANSITHEVVLALSSEKQTLIGEDLDYQNSTSYQLGGNYEGMSIRIGVNGKFLLPMMKQIVAWGNKSVKIEFSEPNSALQMWVNSPYGKAMMLIMPVMINTSEIEYDGRYYDYVELRKVFTNHLYL